MKIVNLFSIFHEPRAPWSFNGNFLSYASKCIMWRILGLVYYILLLCMDTKNIVGSRESVVISHPQLSLERWASHQIKLINYEPRFCHYTAYVVPKMLSVTRYSGPAWRSRERLWGRSGSFLAVLWKLRLKNSNQTVKQGCAHQVWIAHLFFSPLLPFAERTPLPRYLYVM